MTQHGREVYHPRPNETLHSFLIRSREHQQKIPTRGPCVHATARKRDDRPLMFSEPRERDFEPVPPRSPRVEYRDGRNAPIPENALAVVRFSDPAHIEGGGPLTVGVGLTAAGELAADAIWCGAGPVTSGRREKVRFAHDADFLFGVIEAREADYPDIRGATTAVYAAIDAFQRGSTFPYLLRMWNFIDAVNEGAGDLERYRQFCIGRAEGFGESLRAGYPAATAIGRQQPNGLVQVFWVAARTPGTPVENPRQVSAYRYPRTHGPVSPSFSRATVLADGTLLISGTASIVGHASQHPNDWVAQLAETLRNLDSLIAHARQHRNAIVTDGEMLLTVYIRERSQENAIAERIRTAFPNARTIFVAADICRRELLLEIECVVQPVSRAAD